jgi:hypothetical protein
MDAGSKIKNILPTVKWTIFLRDQRRSMNPLTPKNLVFVKQTECIQLFLIMYLSYVNKLVTNKLNASFGNDWRAKKIGFVISVEEILMNSVIGSKKIYNNYYLKMVFSRRQTNIEKRKHLLKGKELYLKFNKN